MLILASFVTISFWSIISALFSRAYYSSSTIMNSLKLNNNTITWHWVRYVSLQLRGLEAACIHRDPAA